MRKITYLSITLTLVLISGRTVAVDRAFEDVSRKSGATQVAAQTTGVAWLDYDNDGDLDLCTANGLLQGTKNILYENHGDGTFSPVPIEADPDKEIGVAVGDYDNDGYPDILTVGYDTGMRIYHNLGNGKFEMVKHEPISGSRAGLFVDLDNDGFLDIAIAAFSGKRILWRNMGDGRFEDATPDDVSMTGHDLVAIDYNNDGLMDICFSTTSTGKLFRNDGGWKFEDVTAKSGIKTGWISIGAGDINNDGFIDIITTSTAVTLYRNNGDGTFTDITKEANVVGSNRTSAAMFGDYDNDGYLDLMLGSSWAQTPGRSYLYHNNGDGTFRDVTTKAGITTAKVWGAAFGDYDNDGAIDLYTGSVMDQNQLYHNIIGTQNHWLTVRLVGTKSNRDGIGAHIKVVAGELTMYRQVREGTGRCQNELTVHFGLGQNSSVDLIEIRWPSGLIRRAKDIPADRIITITEGEEFHVEPRGRFPVVWGRVKRSALLQNYPNPFNPETWIPYVLSADADVTLTIYSLTGQVIRVIRLGRQPAGSYLNKERAIHWDGRNEKGEEVSSGIYFYRLHAGGELSSMRKLAVGK